MTKILLTVLLLLLSFYGATIALSMYKWPIKCLWAFLALSEVTLIVYILYGLVSK